MTVSIILLEGEPLIGNVTLILLHYSGEQNKLVVFVLTFHLPVTYLLTTTD